MAILIRFAICEFGCWGTMRATSAALRVFATISCTGSIAPVRAQPDSSLSPDADTWKPSPAPSLPPSSLPSNHPSFQPTKTRRPSLLPTVTVEGAHTTRDDCCEGPDMILYPPVCPLSSLQATPIPTVTYTPTRRPTKSPTTPPSLSPSVSLAPTYTLAPTQPTAVPSQGEDG